jgi:hypothetical protein
MLSRLLWPLSFVLTGVLVHTAAVSAQVVGGGGSPATDCYVTYDSIPKPNSPSASPKHLKCADGASDCDGQGNGDADPRPGYCRYQIQVSLNTTGFPSCTPTDLKGFAIPYSTTLDADNDTHPKNVPDFNVLATFVDGELPLDAGMTDRVSGFTNVTIPMKIAFKGTGAVFKTTTLKLHPTMCTAGLITSSSDPNKWKCPPGVVKDVDTFKLTCTPATDPSACTTITSTFQQIQEHIFDRKCAIPACHNAGGGLPDLCLASSCDAGTRHAYTDLVGIPPHNFFANSDGLLRVDPGNPGNSYLVHKINGGSQLNSPNFPNSPLPAYEHRMPYHDPRGVPPRVRRKLSAAEIQLITDWINAGAPQAGFVATGRGACH